MYSDISLDGDMKVLTGYVWEMAILQEVWLYNLV